ncbi:MAG: NAD-dependent epimerase/dehydratase family protein [Marinobacter sp.]|nr:NAD-dependent epimerase/dehydratase family protein [Marinobacter sp.]
MAITSSSSPHILLAGCGALGGRIALTLLAQGQVTGLRRAAHRVPEGVRGLAADLLDPEGLQRALNNQAADIVIYCLTPAQYDEQGYRDAYVTGLQNLLTALPALPKHLFFISSTGVYHQDDDSVINEQSPASSEKYSGQQILAGEQVALTAGMAATVIRFSGIYGPSRQRFLDSVIAGKINPPSPGPYTNRIHEDDAAALVAHLVAKALRDEPVADCYIGSDCEPVRLDEICTWIAGQLPCQPPEPGAPTGRRAGSKRCDNSRVLASGFVFQYPSYREGYQPMIAARQQGH